MNRSLHQTDSPWPHRLAVVLAITTFPVIWMGGLVTTYEAGMAVPDWPGTYGYNLFLYPWQTWLLGPWDLFIEHGHRLLAATVGLLTIALTAALWLTKAPLGTRVLAVAALAGVVLQGGLGGMRVLLDERLLARIHACVGPAFFALAVILAAITSQSWRSNQPRQLYLGAGKFQRIASITVVLAYLQIVVGAHLRHQSLSASPAGFRVMVIFHVLLALALAIHVGILALRALSMDGFAWVTRSAAVLGLLIVAQLGLGVGTWVVNYGWPAGVESYAVAAGHTIRAQSQTQALVTTAHVALGSLILATSSLVLVASLRWQSRSETSISRQPRTNSTLAEACAPIGLLARRAAV